MATHITEGQKAPAFKSKDQDGKPVSLADHLGKKLFFISIPKTIHPPAPYRPVTCVIIMRY